MKTVLKSLLLVAALIMFNSGCEEDPKSPNNENPQELITTVILTMVNQANANDTVTVTWKDLDGSGGNAPTIDTLFLTSGVTYSGSIQFLDESKNPPEDITEEVEEEKNAHQVFYELHGTVEGRIVITVNDFDTNTPPLPVGLDYTAAVSAGGAAEGHLHVVLSHYEGTKTAVPSDESDVDIEIEVRIQ
jgi:hypothetical protein